MKPIGIVVAAMAAFAIGTPALAQSNEPMAKPKEKKTCRALMPTGSFLPTRVCNTEARWREFDGANQQGVGEFRRALNMTSTNERDRRQ